MQRPRRRVLQALGAGLSVTAGCLDGDSSPTPTNTETQVTTKPTESPTEPETDRLTTDPGGGFRWAFDLGESAVRPLRSGDSVLTGTKEGVVRALDADGRVRWRTELPNAIDSGAVGEPFALHQGHLLVVTGENQGTGGEEYVAHALNPETGEERWSYTLGRDWMGVLGSVAGGIAVGEGDDAIGPSSDRTALVEPDGTERWVAETGDPNAVADGGGRVYVGAYGAVRGFDAGTGEQLWQVETTPSYLGLAGDATRLYAVEEVERGNVLVARDGETGERRWGREWFATSVYRAAEAGVVAGGERLVSFAPDGTERWSYPPGGSAYGPATEELLFTSPGSDLAAVSLTDGSERWRVDANDAFPRAYGGGLLVSEVLGEGRYLAHDAATGEATWSVTLDAERNPGVAVGSKIVYLVTADGTLLARDR